MGLTSSAFAIQLSASDKKRAGRDALFIFKAMKKSEQIKQLQREKQALLLALPHPSPGSGESPVEYERIEKVDEKGRRTVLEWRRGLGWSVFVER